MILCVVRVLRGYIEGIRNIGVVERVQGPGCRQHPILCIVGIKKWLSDGCEGVEEV